MSRLRPVDPEQHRIDEEASAWVVLAADRALSYDEQCELDRWLAADARHQRTWRELGRVWGQVPQLTGLAELAPLELAANENAWTGWTRRIPKVPAFAVAAAAALVLAIFAVPAIWQSPAGQEYATEVAQTRLLTLPDGTQVTLGPRSTLAVNFSNGERRVTLVGGEAFFEVVHDRERPFFVEAGPSLIRVVGTKFDVNYGGGSVRVGVLEGVVQVSRLRESGGAQLRIQTLRAGQRAEVALVVAPVATSTLPAAITPPPLQAITTTQTPGTWREGRLVFENARLADLVSDVNRYYAPGVSIADPAIGEVRVTASFKASEIPAFLSALDGVVPVRSIESADGTFRLESRRN